MAKRPLLERLALDLKPSGRIPDCERDLSEAIAERGEIDQRIADCELRAENPATPDDDAKLALQQAHDWRFYARRLDRAIADVREAIAAKKADESYLERRKQFEAAKVARDGLLEDWARLGAILDSVASLFARTVENDRLLAQVNQHRPRGEEALQSAEVIARGALSDTHWPNSIGQPGAFLERLTAMEWPAFREPGFAWSQREADRRRLAEADEAARLARAAALAKEAAANTPEARQAKAEAEAARYRLKQLSPIRYRGAGRIPVRHRDGTAGIGAESAQLWMDEKQVAAAKEAGLIVEDVEAAGLKVEALPFLETLGR